MVVEVVFAFLCTCKAFTFIRAIGESLFFGGFSCDPQRWPVEAQRSAALSGNKNVQVSQCRGSSLACMTLQMCYFEREVSSESEV